MNKVVLKVLKYVDMWLRDLEVTDGAKYRRSNRKDQKEQIQIRIQNIGNSLKEIAKAFQA